MYQGLSASTRCTSGSLQVGRTLPLSISSAKALLITQMLLTKYGRFSTRQESILWPSSPSMLTRRPHTYCAAHPASQKPVTLICAAARGNSPGLKPMATWRKVRAPSLHSTKTIMVQGKGMWKSLWRTRWQRRAWKTWTVVTCPMTNHSRVVHDFRHLALLCVMFSWSKHILAGKGGIDGCSWSWCGKKISVL